MKHRPDVPDEDLTVEYMAEHYWLIGSPETVAGKLRKLFNEIGGFGGLLMLVYDYGGDNGGWEKSTRLLVQEVMPRLADLTVD
jgi:alkanesulfonate monooxygenase SsuD/methylene tetrahydromethanopterin reductase-like flavin-dependent oxidoreductase (luciferase family)